VGRRAVNNLWDSPNFHGSRCLFYLVSPVSLGIHFECCSDYFGHRIWQRFTTNSRVILVKHEIETKRKYLPLKKLSHFHLPFFGYLPIVKSKEERFITEYQKFGQTNKIYQPLKKVELQAKDRTRQSPFKGNIWKKKPNEKYQHRDKRNKAKKSTKKRGNDPSKKWS